jgi:hypothetical protein
MKPQVYQRILFQVLLVALTSYAATRAAISFHVPTAEARQDCCTVQPPFTPQPLKDSWPPNRRIAVWMQQSFLDYGGGAVEEIYAGINSWIDVNGPYDSYGDCSGVTFGQPLVLDFQAGNPKPDYTIRVFRVPYQAEHLRGVPVVGQLLELCGKHLQVSG